MYNHFFKLLVTAIFISIVFSCTKKLNLEDVGFDKSYKIAKKKYENENYIEAIQDFNIILLNYGGERGIDSVQYLLASSHFELQEYFSSSYEFNKLSESFPESKLTEESYFNAAMCYYKLSPPYSLDQAETFRAISKFQNYLDLYTSGKFNKRSNELITELREKLARKEYEAGVLYIKMDQPRAAKVYFNEVISNYYDTTYYKMSLQSLAEVAKMMKDEYNYHLYLKRYQDSIKED